MPRLRRLRPSPAAAVLLALALLWAQSLGLLHRLQHAPAAELAAAVVADDGSGTGLFGHDRKSEGCKLYDQLALGDGMPLLPATAALVPGAEAPSCRPQSAATGIRRHDYRARAPPLTAA